MRAAGRGPDATASGGSVLRVEAGSLPIKIRPVSPIGPEKRLLQGPSGELGMAENVPPLGRLSTACPMSPHFSVSEPFSLTKITLWSLTRSERLAEGDSALSHSIRLWCYHWPPLFSSRTGPNADTP